MFAVNCSLLYGGHNTVACQLKYNVKWAHNKGLGIFNCSIPKTPNSSTQVLCFNYSSYVGLPFFKEKFEFLTDLTPKLPFFFIYLKWPEYIKIGGDELLPLGEEFQEHIKCFLKTHEKKTLKQYELAGKVVEQLGYAANTVWNGSSNLGWEDQCDNLLVTQNNHWTVWGSITSICSSHII